VGRDAQAVAHDVGLLLFVPAGAAAVSIPVAVGVGEPRSALPLLIAAGGAGGLGWWLVHRYREARALHRWPAVEVVAFGWLSCALVGAGVLWGIGVAAPADAADVTFASPVDALFEATSGITSTGLSVADGIESQLSRTVQWWRTLLQWVGGVGVVLFAAGFGHTASRVSTLYEAEGRSDDVGGDIRHTVRAIVVLYLGLTVAAVAAFLATEQEPWVAVNHAMTGIATGGFTVTDDSFASFGTTTQLVAMVVIAVGAVSFLAHHLLLVERDVRAWARFTPNRAQLTWWAVGIAGLILAARWSDAGLGGTDLLFQWVSAAGTAGFATTTELATWGPMLFALLIVAMVIGAPSGSTGGGLKLDRVTWVVKDLASHLRGGPGRPATLRWGGEIVEADRRRRSVRHAVEMLGLWLLTLAVGTLALWLLTDAPLRPTLFDAASALSNVGLDAGVVGGDLDTAATLVVTALMYLGRLELLAALVLASQGEHIDDQPR
jgi:trk system potassium uptake protein